VILVTLVATVLAAVVTVVAASAASPLPVVPWSGRYPDALVLTMSQYETLTTARLVGQIAAVATTVFAVATVWALIRAVVRRRSSGSTAPREPIA
jgi:hypothetical protein